MDGIRTFEKYFRGPEDLSCLVAAEMVSPERGFFSFGDGITCYGRCCGVIPSPKWTSALPDVSSEVRIEESRVLLPFSPDEVIGNLREEKYADVPVSHVRRCVRTAARNVYYWIRPALKVGIRRYVQQLKAAGWQRIPFPAWPLDVSVDRLMGRLLFFAMKARGMERIPFVWFWPGDYDAAAIVTHDVETAAGLRSCAELMDRDDAFGIKSSFTLIPEGRYTVPRPFVEGLKQRGFEVAIHDLNHDGTLFQLQKEFLGRCQKLRKHAAKFDACGFRSGALYRNPEWLSRLPFAYDMSVPNVGHLDPQRGGCCTVMPYTIGDLVELPLTTIQDYALFNLLGQHSIELWRNQIEGILREHGLITILVHPDYLNDEDARRVYMELLTFLKDFCSSRRIWMALPEEIARWWKQREQMNMVCQNGRWQIEGQGRERARIGWAVLNGENISYRMYAAQASG